MEKLTGELQQALIEKGYEYLRSICEIAVEAELLQGVTQRYQPNVMMTRLPNIKFDRLREASEKIFSVFEKCCRCIASHSQPLETLKKLARHKVRFVNHFSSVIRRVLGEADL